MPDSVVGVVIAVGPATVYELAGGDADYPLRQERYQAQEVRRKELDKLREKARTMQHLEKMEAKLSPADFEADTGIAWDSHFTDVPDNGNCAIEAFWRGLQSLLKYYPDLALRQDEQWLHSVKDADSFRVEAFARMAEDEEYIQSVRQMMQIWTELDVQVLQSSIEDFFILPEELQQRILEANKLRRECSKTVELGELATCYIDAMRAPVR